MNSTTVGYYKAWTVYSQTLQDRKKVYLTHVLTSKFILHLCTKRQSFHVSYLL